MKLLYFCHSKEMGNIHINPVSNYKNTDLEIKPKIDT